MEDNHLLVVSHVTQHHAKKSGMKGILEYLPGDEVVPVDWFPYRLQRMIADRTQSSYNTEGVRKELAALKYMSRFRRGIVHFLNGEQEFHYTGLFAHALGWRVTATFHKPPSVLHELFTDTHFLRRLDGVFCVSSIQQTFFEGILAPDRIWFVPLGVDTDFFRPTNKYYSDQKICLFVGTHMRDFNVLEIVLSKLQKKVKGLRLIAVVPQAFTHLLPRIAEMEVRSGISDELLRDTYCSAGILLQPLRDSTANCSTLEALACGLPVVANDIGGVRDYLDKSCSFICKSGAIDDMVDAAVSLLEDFDLNVQMRSAARQHALQFSWSRIADTYLRTYEQVFGIDLEITGANVATNREREQFK